MYQRNGIQFGIQTLGHIGKKISIQLYPRLDKLND